MHLQIRPVSWICERSVGPDLSRLKSASRRLDYPNLWNFTKDTYQRPGVAECCNVDHVKQHYYRSHESINPKRIVPLGPDIDYNEPHDRTRFA